MHIVGKKILGLVIQVPYHFELHRSYQTASQHLLPSQTYTDKHSDNTTQLDKKYFILSYTTLSTDIHKLQQPLMLPSYIIITSKHFVCVYL